RYCQVGLLTGDISPVAPVAMVWGEVPHQASYTEWLRTRVRCIQGLGLQLPGIWHVEELLR
ncbi:MAG: hypothetical protein QGF91_07060, partial [Gammaproteobacteria bacterium]|nr:hypothetical protein [Gammaproteobacteria bacterium]